MRLFSGKRRAVALVALFSLVLAGCSQFTDAPQGAGAIEVVVSAPEGVTPSLVLSGPSDRKWQLTGPAVIEDLAWGEYTLVAAPVTHDGTLYSPDPEKATVELAAPAANANRGPLKLLVTYAAPSLEDEPGGGPPPGEEPGPEPGEEEPQPGEEPAPGEEPTPGEEPGPGEDPGPGPDVRPGSTAYYLDCREGKDSAAGTSPSQAWRSLSKLDSASVKPGDRVLFRRGCEWVGPLVVRWSGTEEWPVVVGAYGDGPLPIIRDSRANHVDIFGSHLVIENLHALTTPGSVPTDSRCEDQPVAWRTGFTFQGSAHHVTLRNSRAEGNTAGVHLTTNTSHNRVLNNFLHDNIVMSVNTDNGGWDDSGAWGIVLNGSDNEIAYNSFAGNNAWCSYDFGQEGASIEVYGAQRNFIHHNVSFNDTTFTELGGSSQRRARDNTYAYNQYVSELPNSEFLVVRGSGTSFGPTPGTRAFNNTVLVTGADSQGVVCHAGCSSDILELRNNIIWAEWKSLYADGRFSESNNLYWRSDGRPLLQFHGSGNAMSSSSKVADPRFVDAFNGDLTLRSGSPAVDSGASIDLPIAADLRGVPVPQYGRFDIGAHERR